MWKIFGINFHLEIIIKVLEGVVIILGLGAAMAFSTRHHIWGIWLTVGAFCLVAIVIGIVLTKNGNENAAESHPSPIVNIAPQAQQTFNVMSNNQQSGITAGIVNIAPQERHLLDSQKQILIDRLKPFKGSKDLLIRYNTNSLGSNDFAEEIISSINESGLIPEITTGVVLGPKIDINIAILCDAKSAIPPLADALMSALRNSNIEARGVLISDWPEDKKGKIILDLTSKHR